MADYASRADLDALRQLLQSDPGEKGFPFLRGVPQILAIDYSGALGPALTTDWETFFTYSGRGGMLFPDRVLDVLMVGSRENTGVNPPVSGAIRLLLNTEEIARWEFSVTSGAGASYSEFRARIHSAGSNSAQFCTFSFAGNLKAAPAAENLAEPWTVQIQVMWETIDPDVYFARLHSLVILT